MTKMGVLRMRAGRPDEALDLFRRAVEREPRSGEALLYLAGALAAGGRRDEAIPYFERALEVAPRSTMALNGLGFTRLEVGDAAGAAAALRRSLALDPGQKEVPVLTIALDAGFQSIGPFNRAFKAATGLTPTEFRRLAAAKNASMPPTASSRRCWSAVRWSARYRTSPPHRAGHVLRTPPAVRGHRRQRQRACAPYRPPTRRPHPAGRRLPPNSSRQTTSRPPRS